MAASEPVVSLVPDGGGPARPTSVGGDVKLPRLDIEQFIRRLAKSKTARDQWTSLYRDAYEFAIPQRNTIDERTPGQEKMEHIFDSTAIEATQEFASELQMALMPPFRQWCRLVPGKDIPNEARQEVQGILDHVTDLLFEAIDSSNLHTEAPEAFLDLAAGTASLMVQDSGDADRPLRFTSVGIPEISFEEGPYGTIETVYRCYKLPLRLVLRQWPDAKLNEHYNQLLKDAPDTSINICDACVWEPKQMTYRYVVIDETKKHVFVDRAKEMSPWIPFRWAVVTGEMYGRGPLVTALPDIRTLNRLVELVLRNAALAVSGVYTAVDDGVLNPWTVRLTPGAIIPVMSNDSLSILPRGGDFDIAQLEIQELRQRIKQALYTDDMPAMDDPAKTATEILMRNKKLVRKIGSSFGRLQNELVFRVIEKSLAILQKRKLIDPALKVDGKTIDIHYVGPLAQAQDQDDLGILQTYFDTVLALGPEIMMATTKVEEVPAYIARLLGLPAELMRSPEEIEEIKQAAAEMTQTAVENGDEPGGGPAPPAPQGS